MLYQVSDFPIFTIGWVRTGYPSPTGKIPYPQDLHRYFTQKLRIKRRRIQRKKTLLLLENLTRPKPMGGNGGDKTVLTKRPEGKKKKRGGIAHQNQSKQPEKVE